MALSLLYYALCALEVIDPFASCRSRTPRSPNVAVMRMHDQRARQRGKHYFYTTCDTSGWKRLVVTYVHSSISYYGNGFDLRGDL